jgi:ubiquinone/menaquinone biosynthesis C-methylase UbiE
MSDSGNPLVANLYDAVMYLPEKHMLGYHRDYLVEDIDGPVLDVGAGTGAMFPYFTDLAADHDLYAVEPDPHMRTQAIQKATEVDLDIDIAGAGAADLPYDADTFETVIASFVFCTIPDIGTALDEIARVLKPGGEFRFVEHVRGSRTLGTVHDLLTPGWYHVAGGCHLNRQTGDLFMLDDRFETIDFRRYDDGLTGVMPIVRGRLERRPD